MSAGDQRGVAMLAATRLAGFVLELGAPREVVVETTISSRTQRSVSPIGGDAAHFVRADNHSRHRN
jgi:hypothetical protein